MKILHTSDLHLVEKGDERWDALVQIVGYAKQRSIDTLVISGDLFDSNIEAEALRALLRSVLEGSDFPTLIVPGNHDAEAFRTGLYFGEKVRVLNDPDWSKNLFDHAETRVIGIPFEAIPAQELHRRLRGLSDLVDPERINIVLYHGELLDVSFDREAFGPERGRYMPSRLAYFAELGIDYVLAGHFHTSFDVRQFGEGRYFVYPGSPVSITRRELGRRHVAIIEPGEAPKQIPLDTHHFEQVTVMLDAFVDVNPIKKIEAALEDVHPAAAVLLTVDGTILGAEDELAEAINRATEELKVERKSYGFRDLSRVVQHPVYALLDSRLEELKKASHERLGAEEAELLRQLVIRAMTEAGV